MDRKSLARTVMVVALVAAAGTAAADGASAATATSTASAPVVVHGLIADGATSSPGSAQKLASIGLASASGGALVATPLAVGASRTLTVTVQKQSTTYYCAPASGRVALSALVAASALPSQATIAGRMHTTTSGTSISNIPPALNASQSKNTYVHTTGLDLAGYRSVVQNGIDTYRAPQIDPVEMARLPWYAGTGISGGHAVSTYGYYTATKVWQVHVYDPWDGVRHTYVNSSSMLSASLYSDVIW